MARPPRSAGFTLLECMIAMAVLVLGSVGALSIQRIGIRMNRDARVMARATSLAQDLMEQMQTWEYTDARLCAKGEVGCSSGRTGDFTDTASNFEKYDRSTELPPSDLWDHSDAELTATNWSGVPTGTVHGLRFGRYWNVDAVDHDSNGALTGKRVAVIVHWDVEAHTGSGSGDSSATVGRRIVIVTYIKDPSVTN